jgi:hypothetical protein
MYNKRKYNILKMLLRLHPIDEFTCKRLDRQLRQLTEEIKRVDRRVEQACKELEAALQELERKQHNLFQYQNKSLVKGFTGRLSIRDKDHPQILWINRSFLLTQDRGDRPEQH